MGCRILTVNNNACIGYPWVYFFLSVFLKEVWHPSTISVWTKGPAVMASGQSRHWIPYKEPGCWVVELMLADISRANSSINWNEPNQAIQTNVINPNQTQAHIKPNLMQIKLIQIDINIANTCKIDIKCEFHEFKQYYLRDEASLSFEVYWCKCEYKLQPATAPWCPSPVPSSPTT